MMFWGEPSGWGWWMGIGMLWMVLFWGTVLGLAVWAVRTLAGGRSQSDAQTIAERRFAAGEITKQQLDEIRSALKQ